MRIVVVGATGNVGTSLVRLLADDPAVSDIVAVARRAPETEGALPTKARFVTADVGTASVGELAAAFDGADAVVHLAWLFQPTHSPMVTWEANVHGSIRVFDAAARAGARTIVYASSVGAYSPREGDEPVDESWPTHSVPTSAYGREKAYVERVLDAFEVGHPEVRVVRLRPAFIFQRRAATEQRRLFAGPLVPRFVVRPDRLPVFPYPKGLLFQALHADDAAAAYKLALLQDVRGAFNVAADPVIDGPTLAAAMGARPLAVPRPLVRNAVAALWHLHIVPADAALLDLFLSLPVMDAGRARRELGWSPTTPGTDALREMFDGMADGAGGATPPLAPDSLARRADEVATGVGER